MYLNLCSSKFKTTKILEIFNSQTEGGLSEGIIVSRIMEDGAADQANLKIHDRILKVSECIDKTLDL